MNNRLKNIKLGGFSTVELIITLFVASIFLVAGYQLYSVIIKDGGETRLQAKAGNLAYDYLQQYKIKARKESCANNLADQPAFSVLEEEKQGLPNPDIKVEYSCPTMHHFFKAKYYNGKEYDAGSPPIHTNDEYTINHEWGSGSPASEINIDNFSATWDGEFTVPVTGDYDFKIKVDDEADIIIDKEDDTNIETTHYNYDVDYRYKKVSLDKDEKYKITIKFIEATGNATLQLLWKKSSDPDSFYKFFTPNYGDNFTHKLPTLTKVNVTVSYGSSGKKVTMATYVNKQ